VVGVGEQVAVEEDTHLQTHAKYSMGRRSGLAILNLRATVRMYWKECIVDVGSTAPPMLPQTSRRRGGWRGDSLSESEPI